MNKIIIYIALVCIPIFAQNVKKTKINQSKFDNSENTQEYLEMFEDAFFRLESSYVDSINESEVIKAGINGMLKHLDPYTVFLSGSNKERLDMLRTGKYGGVGIQIGLRRDTLTILAPFEDSPAYSEGIHAGDQILMIDSIKTSKMTIKEASKLIKGEMGTSVKLTIFRPSEKKRISFNLERANIVIKHVPYWGIDKSGIGYIRVTKFSKNTGKDFQKALSEIINQEDRLNGIIIDLRGNSGGLLSNAISMLDLLTERGVNLLNTKGRIKQSNRKMNSRRRPIVASDIPIAILINKSSASASEIVAGTLQDLDRAIIVGEKSFGKGLVQSMYNINDSSTIKITTAKYFTPSGRLIQKEDYFKKNILSSKYNEQDSIYFTRLGRAVKGGGGINPDIVVKNEILPKYVQGIWNSGAFLTFAATYSPLNNIKTPVIITDKIIDDFNDFLKEYEIKYKLDGEINLKRLKEALESTDGLKSYNRLTNRLDKYYKKERKKQYYKKENLRWIKNGLLRELSRVVSGEKERIKVSLYEDNVYINASKVLLDLNQYYDILTPKDSTISKQ
tara:strand:- start:5704 stop:7386 length:1683 start_codon:yes stop_codon:yes gene_type:complete